MKVTAEQVVDLPPAVAFSLFADLERSGEYSKPVIERRKLDAGPVQAGSHYHARDRWPGRTVEFTVEITRFEPEQIIAASWSSPMEGGWVATFSPAGEFTHITFEATIRPSGLMGLLAPIMRPWAQRQTRDFLASFKSWAESQ